LRIEQHLVAAGLSPPEAGRKAAVFEQLGPAERRYFVPGRIEVLGKHTDYAGGRSLLCAVERGFCIGASPRSDRRVRLVDAGRGLETEVPLDANHALEVKGWTVYPATVARRLARNFPGSLRGADIAFASDLPSASGLSSSSALVVALFHAVADVNDLASRAEYRGNIEGPEDLAGYLGCLENGQTFKALPGDRGVGTFGGSEDHTAILCCRPGELARYAFCPVRHERSILLPEGFTFVVAASGVAADKAGGAREKYNRLSLSAAAILDLWRSETGRTDATLLAAATSSPHAPEDIRRILRAASHASFPSTFLVGRFDQFFEETTRIIPAVTEALVSGLVGPVGPLVDLSQNLAERFLQNQVPETTALAREARRLGAAAASAFGAGFGGSVWALVEEGNAEAFRTRWAEGYAKAFPAASAASEFFETRPGPALLRL
jgi:galactokinase